MTYATVCSGVECMSAAVADLPLKPVFFSEIEPFPCAVLESHFPTVPNLGDMSQIKVLDNGQITNGSSTILLPSGGLDILAGGTPCFVAGTMVLTPRGYVPIEDIKQGDEVVSGEGSIRKVTAVGSKMAKVGSLKVLGRAPITCTPNHPFMCVSSTHSHCGRRVLHGDYEETRADESVGKYVGRLPNGENLPPTNIPTPPLNLADALEFAGWYVGDGYIRRFKDKNKKAVILALCSPKKIEKFKARFGAVVHFCEGSDGKLTIYNTQLANWLVEQFGEHAYGKRIPYWLYSLKERFLFLEGYTATDGTTKENTTRFPTVSKALAYGVADLIGAASVCKCRTKPKSVIQGRVVNQRTCYYVSWIRTKTPRTFKHKNRYASIVRSYDDSANDISRVYNLTVEGDHTYIAEGLYTHNCQDVSCAGERRGMAEGSGTRSSLAFEFVRLVRELKPRYILWENVAGVLSTPDFPKFLTALSDCGYGIAYRTLDAQYVRCEDINHANGGVVRLDRAIPQRRRRVWVVGCAGGDLERAAQILFEHPSVCGDNPPRRYTQKALARASAPRARVYDGVVENATAIASNIIGRSEGNGGNGVGAKEGVAYTCDTTQPQAVAYENHPQDSRVKPMASAQTLTKRIGTGGGNLPLVCAYERPQHHFYKPTEVGMTLGSSNNMRPTSDTNIISYGINTCDGEMNPCHHEQGETLKTSYPPGAMQEAQGRGTLPAYIVRRLTPIECERLMGLPEWWTIPVMSPEAITDPLVDEFRHIHDTFGAIMAAYDGKPAPKPKTAAFMRKWLETVTNPDTCPDSPRYRACGNGWATNQPRWIILRLLAAEGINPWYDFSNNNKETTND